MRLLFISNLYPPHDIGGFEQWCEESALRLTARGHTVQVLASNYRSDRAPQGTRPPSLPLRASPANPEAPLVSRALHLEADIEYYRPLDFFLQRPRRARQNLAALRRAITTFQPDVVMFWGMWNLSVTVAHEAERLMPGKVIYFIASYWPLDKDLHRQYWEAAEKKWIARVLKYIPSRLALARLEREGYPPPLEFASVRCCSRFVRDRLAGAGRIPEHAGVLYGGIDEAPFDEVSVRAAQPDATQLLFFGSLFPHKGVHTAVEALGILQRAGQLGNTRLTILGGGHDAYVGELRTLVREQSLGEVVQFIPRIPRREIPAFLINFDVFLFTSIWDEPMARTVMEAMAAGMLVIGSEVGGQMEMFEAGVNSLTFPAGDAAALARHILTIQADPDLRFRLAQAGQQLVRSHFTLGRVIDEMEAWLQDMAG